jgi:hypothetical protein
MGGKSRTMTAVEKIFYQFNLLSDAEFKSWMLNNHDELHELEKKAADASHQRNDKKVAVKNDWKDFYDEEYMNRMYDKFGNWWEKI